MPLTVSSSFASAPCQRALLSAPCILPLLCHLTIRGISSRTPLKIEKSVGNVSQELVNPRPQIRWTPEHLEILRTLRTEKLSWHECTQKFREQTGYDVSQAAVQNSYHYNFLAFAENRRTNLPKNWTSSEIATLRGYKADGLSRHEISKRLNRSMASIATQLSKLGTAQDLRKGIFGKTEIEVLMSEAQIYINQGKRPNWTEIGKLMKRHPPTLHRAWENRIGAVKTGAWADEEDKKLLGLVGTHKDPSVPWRTFALEMNRSVPSVGNRWKYLKQHGRVKDSAT
ncbi:hypothetical protein DFJ77DRAFT_437112 [Powellomyces hirtus]|nr:hypothetical protein DFJ77DRAFT_437112 [Powellomyces hirtus]